MVQNGTCDIGAAMSCTGMVRMAAVVEASLTLLNRVGLRIGVIWCTAVYRLILFTCVVNICYERRVFSLYVMHSLDKTAIRVIYVHYVFLGFLYLKLYNKIDINKYGVLTAFSNEVFRKTDCSKDSSLYK